MEAIEMFNALNADQIEQYWQSGYLCPLDLMTIESVDKALVAFNEAEGVHRSYGLTRPFADYCRINAQILFPIVYQIARQAKMLDMVEGILGPNILIYSAEFFIKSAKTEKIVSWHQDLTYWGLGETDEEMTAWVALSDVNVESGCMRFLPGSHKLAIQPHHDTHAEDNLLSRGQETVADVDETQAVNAGLKPGQVSFHHGRLFHASGSNQSNHARIGLAIRYVTPGVKQLFGDRDYAMVARGMDDSRNWIHLASPRENFDPSNLDLYEQIREEQGMVLMREVG